MREDKILCHQSLALPSTQSRPDSTFQKKKLTIGVNPPSKSLYNSANDLSNACLTSFPCKVAEAVQMVISELVVKASTLLSFLVYPSIYRQQSIAQ